MLMKPLVAPVNEKVPMPKGKDRVKKCNEKGISNVRRR
jgi:hypothetical protein